MAAMQGTINNVKYDGRWFGTGSRNFFGNDLIASAYLFLTVVCFFSFVLAKGIKRRHKARRRRRSGTKSRKVGRIGGRKKNDSALSRLSRMVWGNTSRSRDDDDWSYAENRNNRQRKRRSNRSVLGKSFSCDTASRSVRSGSSRGDESTVVTYSDSDDESSPMRRGKSQSRSRVRGLANSSSSDDDGSYYSDESYTSSSDYSSDEDIELSTTNTFSTNGEIKVSPSKSDSLLGGHSRSRVSSSAKETFRQTLEKVNGVVVEPCCGAIEIIDDKVVARKNDGYVNEGNRRNNKESRINAKREFRQILESVNGAVEPYCGALEQTMDSTQRTPKQKVSYKNSGPVRTKGKGARFR